jgi:hypothetical protein
VVLHALSILFAVIAAGCIFVAIAMMVRGDQDERRGYVVRLVAVVCFGLAVLLNVLR